METNCSVIANFDQLYWQVSIVVAILLGLISVILEVAAIIAELTPSKRDDAIVASLQKKWSRVRPYLELIPHIKTPTVVVVRKAAPIISQWFRRRK